MSKFNGTGMRVQPGVMRATSVMKTAQAPTGRTFNGAPGWQRDAKTELFLRATSSFMGGEKSFYEDGATRDARAIELVRQLAVEDFDWVFEFLRWLRAEGNMRTAPIMLAPEAVHARLEAGFHGAVGTRVPMPVEGVEMVFHTGRALIDVVCQRPDEPGELLAYWMSAHGRSIPKPIKRGIADAAARLYSERSLLKYDTASHAMRFADVLELTHASPAVNKAWQHSLFMHAIDRRHGRDEAIPDSLQMLRKNALLRSEGEPQDWLDADRLREAGMTWEDALSAVGSKVDKAKIWEAMIPSMSIMALIRNLRNFDEVGISDKAANSVIAKLVDETEIARSKQFPYRFYAAYKSAPSLRWGHALDMALSVSTQNVPELPGRTLVLVDTSASMDSTLSAKSTMTHISAAAVFGSVLAMRNHGRVDLYQFANFPALIPVAKGGSVLKTVEAIENCIGDVGHGTEIAQSIVQAYKGHDRVIVISDMQTSGRWRRDGISSTVPAHVPIYAFNTSAYTHSPMPTGSDARFDLGGLTDSTFKQIQRLEAGASGSWPWEAAA